MFGCRRCLTFGSGVRLRPPNLAPNLHGFRLWKGYSAAEGAAKSALSSPFMVVFYACFDDVLGGFWELFLSCLKCVWHLIRVHLCRIRPEGLRRPSVLAVAESVQRLPEDRTRGTEEAISVSCCRVSPASARGE
ncbi:hypothetical protein MANES_14G158166v8 [Manihot esculenta]|uniref:Uncharacterized protein n=1 Tax=Manihot esculenta TaxID=3983 RepID=A0ACB7GHV7_MANES|nr:hypothetical protein MANES_14G158166v8 [Manihot esculenta]